MTEQLWKRFKASQKNARLSQAILLIGPLHANLLDMASRMAAAIICKQKLSPCGECQSCRLITANEHPDISYLLPEKPGSAIKIEQVRSLHNTIFISPQLGQNRIVIIQPAEKMNVASANALLKILEEPPDNTYFILIAEQISTLPATIMSRCQSWRLSSGTHFNDNYLTQGSYYSPESSRGKLFGGLQTILQDLIDLQDSDQSINRLALKWANFEFNELIWFLYLINAQMLAYYFHEPCPTTPIDDKLIKLAKRIKPVRLYELLDKLNGIIRRLNHTLSINQLLALEELLLGYC